MSLGSATGNLKVKGAVTAAGFKHSDSTTGTNNYILLAGGGTKAVSDFATSSSLGSYLPKTTYEWNKEYAAGGNGAVSLGRYNLYDTQLTFDITTTTTITISGKLVIAAQNGQILKVTVYGDASNTLAGYLTIYQSAITGSRSWVEVFCNFPGWSKNKVHMYGVALNSATVTRQMESVTFTGDVPSGVTSGDTKWTGTIVNDITSNCALKSEIPTVNNATLTIQKNGTNVATFTANASSNVTANITVPTKISDLTDDSGHVKGPSSSTDNAIMRFDGTGGKTAQNSGVTIDDSNNISTAGSLKLTNNGDILWNSGSWWQRIKITDDSTANTNVFEFQQSSDSGSNYTSLFTILDNGTVSAKGFVDADLSPASGKTKDDYVLLAGGGTKALSDFTGTTYGADRGISLVSGKFGHSNTAVTAVTTAGLYKIKYDAYGHITGTESFTLPTVNNATLTMNTSGTGISGSQTFTANQSTAATFTVTLDSSVAGNRGANKVVLAAAAGQINSEKYAITSGATVKATYQYNSTDDCVELVWA